MSTTPTHWFMAISVNYADTVHNVNYHYVELLGIYTAYPTP